MNTIMQIGNVFRKSFLMRRHAVSHLSVVGLVISSLITFTALVQTAQAAFVSNDTGSLFLEGISESDRTTTAVSERFLAAYGQDLGMTNDTALSFIAENEDDLGMKHVQYNQYYNGVPVFGAQVNIHLDKNYNPQVANGSVVSDLSLNTTPTLSAAEAEMKARELWQAEFNQATPQVRKTKLYVFNKEIVTNRAEDLDDTYLVWEVVLTQKMPPLHEKYFIDAHTGELVYQITGMQDVVDRDVYDCSYGDLSCQLDKLLDGYIYGRSEGQSARGANPTYGTYDTDDMYDYFGSIHDYYFDTYGLNGANGLGGIGDDAWTYAASSTTGFAIMDDSSWGDLCPNAFFDGYEALWFCRGYVTKDITGHEYAHAVDYFNVLDESGDPYGLIYSSESGALNESISDIFGEAFENYYSGSNNWELGEDLSTGAMRSMKQPSDYWYSDGLEVKPYPEYFNDPNFSCTSYDSYGVHINSAIQNYAAYLIAEGGSFNSCYIGGIGQAKEEAIFYRALTEYYTPATDFNDAFSALLSSCVDLYGDGSDCLQVRKALLAVEMDQAGACSAAAEVIPDCASIDTAPTIVSVTSDKPDGYYKQGDVIDIDVNFSEAVTATGEVTVTLETGASDRTCTFIVSNATLGTCDYTVKKTDNNTDLSVVSISGIIENETGDDMLNFTPALNLASSSNIVIDTKKPTIPTLVSVWNDQVERVLIKQINPKTYSRVVKNYDATPILSWNEASDDNSGVKNYYVKFTNKPIKKRVLLRNKNKRNNRSVSGKVKKISKQYKLYMIIKDQAGNTTKRKRLLKYKIAD